VLSNNHHFFMPRFHCPTPLLTGTLLELPASAARHVQVLRLQPGDTITLFDGQCDGEFAATVTEMGRSHVRVQVGTSARFSAMPHDRFTWRLGCLPTTAWTGW
jgi:16S rRNA U1498 N3-methylase RsmE